MRLSSFLIEFKQRKSEIGLFFDGMPIDNDIIKLFKPIEQK